MQPSTRLTSIGPGIWLAIGLLLASFVAVPTDSARSSEGDRTLRLYHMHTGERGEFTFKRNGQYDRAVLARLNNFVRDWRKEQPISMDPKLFDLIWSIYRETGSTGYISVVCGYRTVGTNDMLRSRGRGVAQHSQHSLGKAMDFFIPGVPLARLRAIAMKFQGGGVGFYPTSGSPFVHVDTGHVRMWPRMTRQQLLAVFPTGETLYIPSDGKPLPGYERALARAGTSSGTALAYLNAGSDEGDGDSGGSGGGGGGGWLKRVFGSGKPNPSTPVPNAPSPSAVASAAVPTPSAVARSAPVELPVAPAPAAVPKAAETSVAVAMADAPADPRLPRARPTIGAEPEVAPTDIASGEPEAPAAEAHPTEGDAVASLAFAPLPRTRPDPTLLVDSLQARASAPTALSVGAEDALAALAARSGSGVPSAPADAPVAVAYAETPPAPALEPDAGDRAGTSAPQIASRPPPTLPPTPRPRPLALASLDPALAWPKATQAVPRVQAAPAAVPAPKLALTSGSGQGTMRSGKGDRLSASHVAPKAVANADQAALRAAVAEARGQAFTGFAMPQPAGVAALFSVPRSAADVATASASLPPLPIGRLALAEGQAASGQQSFFSRLFASLTE